MSDDVDFTFSDVDYAARVLVRGTTLTIEMTFETEARAQELRDMLLVANGSGEPLVITLMNPAGMETRQ